MIYVWNQSAPSSNGSLSGKFFSNGGYLQILFTGSAWSNADAPGHIGADLIIDGKPMATARVWANEPNSHKALVLASTVVPLNAGAHKVSISPATPSTKIDHNDLFTLTLEELAFPQRVG